MGRFLDETETVVAKTHKGRFLDESGPQKFKGRFIDQQYEDPDSLSERDLEGLREKEINDKRKAEATQAILKKASDLAALNPVSWTSKQLQDHFKQSPPQNIEEQAKANAALEAKKRQEKRLAEEMLPPEVRPKKGMGIDIGKSIGEFVGSGAAGAFQGTLGISGSIYRVPKMIKKTLNVIDKMSGGGNPVVKKLNDTIFNEKQLSFLSVSNAVAEDIEMAQRLLPSLHPSFQRNADLSLQADEALKSGDPNQILDVVLNPNAWAAFIGQAVPSLLLAYQAGGHLGFTAFLEAAGQASSADDFEQRTGIKISDEEYTQAFLQTALINGLLEKAGVGPLLKGKKAGADHLLKMIMLSPVTEGLTEGLQELNSNLAARFSYDKKQELLQGVLASVMGGAGAGVGAAGGFGAEAALKKKAQAKTIIEKTPSAEAASLPREIVVPPVESQPIKPAGEEKPTTRKPRKAPVYDIDKAIRTGNKATLIKAQGGFSFPSHLKGEMGSGLQFKKNMGKLRPFLRRGGTALDKSLQQLKGQYPHLFDQYETDADLLHAILNKELNANMETVDPEGNLDQRLQEEYDKHAEREIELEHEAESSPEIQREDIDRVKADADQAVKSGTSPENSGLVDEEAASFPFGENVPGALQEVSPAQARGTDAGERYFYRGAQGEEVAIFNAKEPFFFLAKDREFADFFVQNRPGAKLMKFKARDLNIFDPEKSDLLGEKGKLDFVKLRNYKTEIQLKLKNAGYDAVYVHELNGENKHVAVLEHALNKIALASKPVELKAPEEVTPTEQTPAGKQVDKQVSEYIKFFDDEIETLDKAISRQAKKMSDEGYDVELDKGGDNHYTYTTTKDGEETTEDDPNHAMLQKLIDKYEETVERRDFLINKQAKSSAETKEIEKTKKLFVQAGDKQYAVASLEEASKKFSEIREASGARASELPTPLIVDQDGKVIGHIAYNGRIFEGLPQNWTKDTKLLYESKAVTPKEVTEETPAGKQTLIPGTERTLPEGKLAPKKAQEDIDLMEEKEAAAKEEEKKQEKLFPQEETEPEPLGKPTERPPDPIEGSTVNQGGTPMRLERPVGVIPRTSAVDVMKSLADVVKAFGGNVPIRVGRIPSQSKLIGIFKVLPEVIRIRTANDILTATHEVGHAIEKLVFGWPKGGPWKGPLIEGKMQKELMDLGKALYGSRKPAGGYKREGFAEFVRFWITNPSQLQKSAPTFTDWFNNQFLKENQNGAKALKKSREMAKRFQEQGSVARAKVSIVDLGTIKERMERIKKAIKNTFSIQNHVEMLQPIFLFSKEVERKLGRKLTPEEDPYSTAKALRTTHDARVRVMVEENMIDIAGNPVGPPLADIAALVKNKRADFTVYLWAKRAVALWNDPKRPSGRNPGISLQDAEQVIKELETAELQLAAQKVYDWNDGILNYAAEASPDFKKAVEKIREVDPGYYIPLSREFRELDNLWARGSARVRTAQVTARLKGSGRRIKDPFPQMISNARSIVKATHNRVVLEQIIKLSKVEGMGHLIEKVPRKQVPVLSQTIEELIDRINKELLSQGAGIGIEGEADITSEAITFFMPETRPQGKDPIIPVYNKGELEFYQVDGALFDTLQSMEVYRLPQVAGLPILDWIFGKPARVFRAGTTGLRATFGLITNPIRDLQTLYMNSQANVNALHLFGAWIKSIGDAAFKRVTGRSSDPYLNAFIRLGGEMAQPLGQDIEQTRRAARRLFQGRIVRTLDPRNMFDFVREILQFPETGSRVAELRSVAKQVGWEPGRPMTFSQSLQLLLASKEATTDFTAAGEFSRVMNQMVPFYNAAIQGPRANIRAAQRDSKKFFLRGLLGLTIPTLLLWWNNKDEDWYKELNAREKFTFWYFPVKIIDETLVRIPRAFEVGQVFASLPEAFLDAWYRQDPKAVKEWFGTFLEMSSPFALPVLLEESFEQANNRDFYWDRPIVPMRLEKKPEKEQFDEYTSRISVTLGDIFNVSPKRIDHAIRGLFGNVAGDVIETLGLGPDVVDREKTSADLAVIGALFKRGGLLGTSPRSVNEMYDLMEDVTKKQYSDKNPETKKERQLRLMLTDAQRAVSAILYVRSQTKETEKQRALTQKAIEISKEVVANYNDGRVNRGEFRGARKRFQSQKAKMEPV